YMSYMFDSGYDTEPISLTPQSDSSVEGTETVIATVTTDMMNGYDVGSPSSATINLYDDDTVQVSVSKIADAAENGDNGTFRITRTGSTSGSLTGNFAVSGTATSGTDFTSIGTSATIASGNSSVDVSVAALADNVVEAGGETVVMTLTDGGSAYSAYGT